MLDVSFGEFILVLLVAMAFLGPDRIPVAARKIGEWTRAVKDAIMKVREDVTSDTQAAEAFTQMQQTMQEISQAVNVRHVVRELSAPLMSPLEPGAPASTVAAESDPSDKSDKSDKSDSADSADPSDKSDPSDPPPMESLIIEEPPWLVQHDDAPRLERTFHPAKPSDDQSV
ncbi:twin-arginine translocase TatA/TatE family subunit [Myxococcota bacterium]|nr:twin-arginine translocase TatA/TatE family subunit [Myxococcota bacterium]MBU1510513.1 twin-arginine translocase TatA/TatE family subunit [Myxococcota bacterium]